jgi:NitT/TauT family transport system permease protein
VLIIAIIWPILFTIIGGIKNRREDLEEAATIFGAKGFKRLIYFTYPELSPSIVTGSIVGWGEAWEFIIGAELLVNARVGIGSYLGQLGNNKENLLLVFGILVLMILLFIINKLIWLPLLDKTTKYQSES